MGHFRVAVSNCEDKVSPALYDFWLAKKSIFQPIAIAPKTLYNINIEYVDR